MARGVGGEGGAVGGRDPMNGGVGSRGFSGGGFGGGNGGAGGFGAMGSPSAANYRPPVPMMPKPTSAAQQNLPPWLMQQMVPGAMLGGQIQGLQDYSVNLPQYSYFGQPGQTRPAMFGGQMPQAPQQGPTIADRFRPRMFG